jgi:hypothetical protein
MLWWTAATSTRSNVTISFRCHARRLRVRSMASRMRPYARDQSTVLAKPSVRNHSGNERWLVGCRYVISLQLDVSFELCMARALRRQDHPTLPASHPELQSIIKRFFTQLCPPGGNEGFDCILSASSSAELAAVLDRVHGLASESRRQARAATTPLAATGYGVPFGLHPTTSSAQPSVPFGFSTPLNVHAPQHIGSFGLGLLQPAQQHRSAPTSTNLAYTGSDDTSLLRMTSRSDPNAELEEQIALTVQRKADAVANEDYRKVCASVGRCVSSSISLNTW